MRKSKRVTKYDKRTMTCDIETAQYKGQTVLYEKKSRWETEIERVTFSTSLEMKR